MARVKGNKTPLVSFKIGAASATNFGSEVVKITWEEGEGSQTTMSDVASGNRPVALTLEFVLDFAASSVYEYLSTNAGTTAVTYEVKYDGVGARSQTNPSFTGTLTLPAKPLFEVEMGTEDSTFEITAQVDTWNKVIA